MNKDNINELNMDYQTYKKIAGTLNPKDKASVTITGDKPKHGYGTSTSVTTGTMEENAPEAAIEPKDKATIKYLSNVKDANTGEISKPFVIGDKRYQMVRGQHPTDGVVMGVYSFDELNEAGENIIHPIDYFEETIALPYKQKMEEGGFDYAAAEREYHDKQDLLNYLNLADVEGGAKHFFVDITNGKIIAQFKNTKEMVKSGVKLGQNQDYMDLKTLKKFRFGEYFKKDMSEEVKPEDAGTNVSKLQSDVKKLVLMIKNKFSVYLSKLDKPIEQAQFLSSIAQEIGVPLNKLSSIMTTYKDIAKDGDIDNTNISGVKAESRVITKKELEESVKPITIKVKDIKNER